jgi:hypothetical protein
LSSKNTTPCNNLHNTSNDDKTNRHTKKSQLNTTINLHPEHLFRGRMELRRKNLLWMADGRAEQNGMAFSQHLFPDDAGDPVPGSRG